MTVAPGRGPGALATEVGSFSCEQILTPGASGLGESLAVSFMEQPGGEERAFADLGVGGV